MSNICLQEIQSIHSPDERASFFSFFPRDWKHVHRRLWLKAALEFPSFTRWIITPQQQQQQQQCRDHYSLHSQLDYLLRLGTTRKKSTFMRFSFLLSFFVIYFVTGTNSIDMANAKQFEERNVHWIFHCFGLLRRIITWMLQDHYSRHFIFFLVFHHPNHINLVLHINLVFDEIASSFVW